MALTLLHRQRCGAVGLDDQKETIAMPITALRERLWNFCRENSLPTDVQTTILACACVMRGQLDKAKWLIEFMADWNAACETQETMH